MLERWWSEKYKLPANHPLLLERTLPDLQREWWLDLLHERDSLQALLEVGGMDPEHRQRVWSRLSSLERALDPTPPGSASSTGDPLIDKWEQEFAEGRTPDLAE